MNQRLINTGTVTWTSYNNLGTLLQAYALQKVLYSLGYRNEVISDEKITLQHKRRPLVLRICSNLWRLFSADFFRYYWGQKRINKLFNEFRESHLKINNDWISENELHKKYDVFICGSDQIWSTVLPLNLFYYLRFTTKPKIAYAPSIGANFYPESRKQAVKPYLDKFNSISVREEIGKQLISSFINKKISVVLDPTLLLDQSGWKEFLTPNRETTKNKVLCYFLTFNKKYIDRVLSFAKQNRIPLYIIITDQRFIKYADVPLFIGPKEFISEVASASYIFTDSFHGTIFSILFKKQFLTFERFKTGTTNDQNSRIHNLLTKLELNDCLIRFENSNEKNLCFPNINYDHVFQKLNCYREQSLAFLKNALEDSKKNVPEIY